MKDNDKKLAKKETPSAIASLFAARPAAWFFFPPMTMSANRLANNAFDKNKRGIRNGARKNPAPTSDAILKIESRMKKTKVD